MNIPWSNIYVLQCLVVLNVDGLKLVPADRTVIKQNGTTRTISRYYLLPQTDDDTRVILDSSASTDGDFAQFLRAFNPNRKKKIIKTKRRKPKPKKKTVERYRIYIKRKLRRPKPRKGAKSLPKKGKSDPDMSSENQTITKIYKKRRPITTTSSTLPNAPTVSDGPDESEENVTAIKKKIKATPTSGAADKPKKKDDDSGSEENPEASPQPENTEPTEPSLSENITPESPEHTVPENNEEHDDEPVLRTNDSEFLAVEESTHGAYQFAPDIEPEITSGTNDKDTTEREDFPDVVFTKNDEPARAGDNMTEPIQSIETTSTGIEASADPLRTEGDIQEDTTTSLPLDDNYYKFDEDTTVNTDNPEYITKAANPNVDYIRTSTTEYGKTARSPPSGGYHYHESTEYFENLTNPDYNQTQNYQSTPTQSPVYADYVLTTTEHAEPIKKPYHLLYNVATTNLYSDFVNNFTYPAINQYSKNKDGNLPFQDNNVTDDDYPKNPSHILGGYDLSMTESPKSNQEYVQNVETTTNPPFLGGTPPNDNFKTMSIEHKVNIIDPSNLGFNNSGYKYQNLVFNNSGFEYQTNPPVYFSSYKTSDKVTNNIVRPVFTNINPIVTQRPNTLNEVPPQNYNYQYPQYSYVTTYNTGGKLQESPNKLFTFNIHGYTGKPQTVQTFIYSDNYRNPPYIGSTDYIKYPSYTYYNQPSTEYSKTIRSPVDVENTDNTEFQNVPQQPYHPENAEFSVKTTSITYPDENTISNTASNPAYVSPYQDDTEARDANTQIPLNYNIENNSYSGTIQPPLSDVNGKGAEYSEYINRPIIIGTEIKQGQPFAANQVNDGISQTIIKPPVSYSNAQYSTYQQYPPQITNSQEYRYPHTVNSKPQINNIPLIGYYKESSEYKETVNPVANKEGSQYIEPITDSVHYVYNNPVEDYTETIIKRPVINNNQGSIIKQITFQPYGGQQQSHDIKYSGGNRLPPYNVPALSQSIPNPENTNIPPHEVHQQSHSIESSYVYPFPNTIKQNIQSPGQQHLPIEYLNTLTHSPNVYRPQSHSHNDISRNPPYLFNNQLGTQNAANYQTHNPLYQIINNQVFEYPGNPSSPGYDQAPNIDITPKPAPIFEVPNPTLFPNDNSISTPAFIPTHSSSPTPEIENNPKKVIDDSELKNTSNYQWNNYLDVTTPGNDWLPETTQTNSNSNKGVLETENEREVIDHPPHQDNSMNIASLCPACFKQVTSDYILDKPFRGKNPKITLIELFENPPSANKKVKHKHIHSSHTPSAGSSSGKVQIHSIIDILKDLQNHRHPKKIYSHPYKDRDLYQIIDYLLKGDTEDTDRNNKLTNVPSMELFTVDNLKNVLEAFEDYKLSDIDKETANLYNIIKLILETAETQPDTSEEDDGLWFNQLPSAVGNPMNNYVYNLLQQMWLQELMLQLINNDYNLDVTRNPRWAAYLGAWRLPRNLMNTIYNQGDYMSQNPQLQGNIFGQLGSHNLKGDADLLLTYLQKHLLNTELIYGRGSIQYYLKLNGILNRLALFLRGAGYPQYVVNALIHKLFTALDNNVSKVQPYKNSMHKSSGMCPAGG